MRVFRRMSEKLIGDGDRASWKIYPRLRVEVGKFALLIGVGDYRSSEFADLAAAVPDVNAMQTVLLMTIANLKLSEVQNDRSYWGRLIWTNKSLSSAAISAGGWSERAIAIQRSTDWKSPQSIARDAALRWRTDRAVNQKHWSWVYWDSYLIGLILEPICLLWGTVVAIIMICHILFWK